MRRAARFSDYHLCSASTGIVPHVGGPLVGPGDATVQAEHLIVMRASDGAVCMAPPDAIVTGAATVTIGHKPAARTADFMMHGSRLPDTLSPTVFIGGPTAGLVIGDVAQGVADCRAAATGRNSGETGQSYSNCSIESNRQLINRRRAAEGKAPVSEDALLQEAQDHGLAEGFEDDYVPPKPGDTPSPDPDRGGGSFAEPNQTLLERHGVEASLISGDDPMAQVIQALADGKGVVTNHVPIGRVWNTHSQGAHAMRVIGMEFDSRGNPKEVIVNDTGRVNRNCGRRYSAHAYESTFMKSRTVNPDWAGGEIQNGPGVITKDPL
ncbi:MAG: PAAR domain-containing protein [Myxococcota bacterium]